MASRASAAIAAVFLLLATGTAAAQSSVTIAVEFGSTDNACAAPLCAGRGWTWPSHATWAGGVRSFADPTPPGARVVGITAVAIGRCDGRPADIAVNGINLGRVQYTGTACVCDSTPCNRTNEVTMTWPTGMPGWIDGGSNQVSIINYDPNFVVVDVELTIRYGGDCGNGIVNAGEECDDGTANSDTLPDACRTNCTRARCGDGVRDTGESCDAGSMNSDTLPNACRTSCMLAGCGDGVIDSGETCDDGVANSNTRADACRTTCVPASCGDRVIDSGEACDDGASGSARCTGTCMLRPDAGVPDAGVDAGADAGMMASDAGMGDAGTGADSGVIVDAGGDVDSSVADSGSAGDAGPVPRRRARAGCACDVADQPDRAGGTLGLLVLVAAVWRAGARAKGRGRGRGRGKSGRLSDSR